MARELVTALPGGALLWCGNSLSVRDADLLLPPRDDIRVIASRGASGIDGTTSTAAGAALAHARQHPGAVAFALIGDLTLLHDAPGLALGPAEPRPDLCLVVVNNDGGGIFAGLEPARFAGPFERVFATPHGASLAHLAAAFGIPCTLAERPGDIAQAVAATVPGSGLRIVEARTGLAGNARLRARMSDAAAGAVAAWPAALPPGPADPRAGGRLAQQHARRPGHELLVGVGRGGWLPRVPFGRGLQHQQPPLGLVHLAHGPRQLPGDPPHCRLHPGLPP